MYIGDRYYAVDNDIKKSKMERVVDGKTVPMTVKAGDKVLYSKYAGTEVKLDGEELIIVRQSDILAIVE